MGLVRRSVSVGVLFVAILALPAIGLAQTEAVITGVVTDSSGGVLPGVTVTAVHDATGNTFTSVTDERGVFRMQARVGAYQILMELQGFQSVRAQVTLLAGQTANIPVQMQPATLQENVTVTAEAPLVNVTQTSPAGNIDPKQFSELPAEGRNWMALLLVAPGSRTTSVNQNAPIPMRGGGGDQQFFQTNVDGQQVSNELGGGRQPLMSQEMISELQFISNRFDATQGRSLGVQVNVITKSGTNRYSGSVRGNFRDSDIGAVQGSADRQLVRRSDYQGPAAFLRLPGLRPQPEHRRLDDPVSEVQRVEGRTADDQAGWHPLRLPDFVADPLHGEGRSVAQLGRRTDGRQRVPVIRGDDA